MKIYDKSWRFMRIHKNSVPFTVIHENSWQYTTHFTNIANHEDTWQFLIIYYKWGFLTFHDYNFCITLTSHVNEIFRGIKESICANIWRVSYQPDYLLMISCDTFLCSKHIWNLILTWFDLCCVHAHLYRSSGGRG